MDRLSSGDERSRQLVDSRLEVREAFSVFLEAFLDTAQDVEVHAL